VPWSDETKLDLEDFENESKNSDSPVHLPKSGAARWNFTRKQNTRDKKVRDQGMKDVFNCVSLVQQQTGGLPNKQLCIHAKLPVRGVRSQEHNSYPLGVMWVDRGSAEICLYGQLFPAANYRLRVCVDGVWKDWIRSSAPPPTPRQVQPTAGPAKRSRSDGPEYKYVA